MSKQWTDTSTAGVIPCDLGLIGGTIGMGIVELICQTVLPAEVVVGLLAKCQCLIEEGRSELLRLTRLVLFKPVL
jgi:transcription elongation factor GreA-like protein